jgi:hypothetical protein
VLSSGQTLRVSAPNEEDINYTYRKNRRKWRWVVASRELTVVTGRISLSNARRAHVNPRSVLQAADS